MKAFIFLLVLILLMSIEMNILLFCAYKKLKSTLKNRWISVDEALPIYDGLVLAIDKNNTDRLCIYTELGWLSQYGNPMIAHITHWQPLPEPPKESDTNE